MGKLFLLLFSSFTCLMVAMDDTSKGWQHSDQHKLVKGKNGVIMDYSYDHLTSRWILNSECWQDGSDNYCTKCYEEQESYVQICTFSEHRSGAVLKSTEYISSDQYAALDFKPKVLK